jgi:Arc/MetJ-type ribon-helix-helix transcriptional regulator
MKVSVSLPDEDMTYIDEYARRTGAPSRSSVLHKAVTLLRMSEIEDAYASAWDEWRHADGDAWGVTVADGLHGDWVRDAAR